MITKVEYLLPAKKIDATLQDTSKYSSLILFIVYPTNATWSIFLNNIHNICNRRQ